MNQLVTSTSMPLLYYRLDGFAFDRILDDDPQFHVLTVLGSLPVLPTPQTQTQSTQQHYNRLPAILRIERIAFPPSFSGLLSAAGVISTTKFIAQNDNQWSFQAWLARREDIPDAKITVILPATSADVEQYTKQERVMISETPEIYHNVVRPYILECSVPKWFRDVRNGRGHTEYVICRTPRFVVLHDKKWRPSSPLSNFQFVMVVSDTSIRSLRDLRGGLGGHVDLLEEIRDKACSIAKRRWGFAKNDLRMFVMYQPCYYPLHVFVVHATPDMMMGAQVGQAHMLDDLISMLKYSPDILSKLTLSYALRSRHPLYQAIVLGTESASS